MLPSSNFIFIVTVFKLSLTCLYCSIVSCSYISARQFILAYIPELAQHFINCLSFKTNFTKYSKCFLRALLMFARMFSFFFFQNDLPCLYALYAPQVIGLTNTVTCLSTGRQAISARIKALARIKAFFLACIKAVFGHFFYKDLSQSSY